MTAAHLEVRGLTARLGHTTVLRDLHLTATPGRCHALVGPNGAGKTTLLNLVAGTLRPSTGRILLNGRDIAHLPPHRRARLGIARTWQHPALCMRLSTVDNLRLATPAAGSDQRVQDLLYIVDLAASADVPAEELSYGQQRWLELAVALAARPRLLLLDEPTSGLTQSGIADLVQHLRSLRDDTTIVVAEHDAAFIHAVADTTTAVGATPGVDRLHPLADAAAFGSQVGATAQLALQVRRLTVGYGTTRVLDDIALNIFAGDVLVITGANGSGKSTLLRAIAGLHGVHPRTSIALQGRDVTALSAADRSKLGIGLVRQHQPPHSSLTVADHLQLVSRRSNGNPIWTVSRVLELFPALHPSLGQAAARLSGGTRRQLAIAQALLAHPVVLLLDEPYAGLSTELARRLTQHLAIVAGQGTAVLLVTHDVAQARVVASATVRLAEGQLHPDRVPAAEPDD